MLRPNSRWGTFDHNFQQQGVKNNHQKVNSARLYDYTRLKSVDTPPVSRVVEEAPLACLRSLGSKLITPDLRPSGGVQLNKENNSLS